MQIIKKPALPGRLRGFIRLGHPVPVFFHFCAVAVFALLAGWPALAWGTLALVVSAHTAMQLAIAVWNDYCDRARDAQGQSEKPIPSGLVSPREAFLTGCLLLIGMACFLWPLPPLAWLYTLGYLTLGMAYNLGLKSTPLSGIVFSLAMPLIPLYAFAGMGQTPAFLIWLWPIGFLLGISLNLANSLPDLEEDARSGARTLAVTLGLRGSFGLNYGLLALAALLILSLHLSGIQRLQPLVLIGMLIVVAALLLVLLLSTGVHKARETRRRAFYLTVLTALILAGGWLLGVLL